MVTFAAAAAAAAVVIVLASVLILVVVIVVAVLTCNQTRSSNYGHDTNQCDQFFMFFIIPHR